MPTRMRRVHHNLADEPEQLQLRPHFQLWIELDSAPSAENLRGAEPELLSQNARLTQRREATTTSDVVPKETTLP